jgi:hypothetical protein
MQHGTGEGMRGCVPEFRSTPWTLLGAALYRRIADLIAATADVRIDGERPWDIQVQEPNVCRRHLTEQRQGAAGEFSRRP